MKFKANNQDFKLTKIGFFDMFIFYFFNKQILKTLKNKSDYISPTFYEVLSYYFNKNNHCFLLKKNLKIIAFFALVDAKTQDYKDYKNHFLLNYNDYKNTLKLDGIAIIKKYRHQKIMKKLFVLMSGFINKLDYKFLVAHVSPNNHDSYKILKHHGFKKVNQVKMETSGYLRDCLIRKL